MLRWNQPGSQTAVDETLPMLLHINDVHFSLELLSIGERRDATGIESRDPVTSEVRNGELVVSIRDSQPGARWYRFRLTRK